MRMTGMVLTFGTLLVCATILLLAFLRGAAA